MNNYMNVMHTTTCNCAACAPVPTLGIKMPYEEEEKKTAKPPKKSRKLIVGENDLATVAPKVAAMLSEKDKHFAFEVTAGSKRKLTFVCPDCGQEFEAKIKDIFRSVGDNATGCPVCAGRKVAPGINDLASQCPEAAAMLSEKDKHIAFEVTAGSHRRATFVCPNCKQEFEAEVCCVTRSVNNDKTGCPVCAGKKVVPGINDLASKCPKAAAMWSRKNKKTASEVVAKSKEHAIFVCSNCKQEFESAIYSVVNSVNNGHTGCPVCAGLKVIPGINDLASQCPEAAAMWSDKNEKSAFEVAAMSNKKAFFKCRNCEQEFETKICHVADCVGNGNTGCPVCAGRKVVPGINDLASQCPEVAAMWSDKNKLSASEVTSGSKEKVIFVCRDCGQEFEASIVNVVRSVSNDCTGCYNCKMKKIGAISKPECFVVRPMMAFAGENGIANPFADVRNILGENSLLGLDFVDHIQKFCAEYNGKRFHEYAAEKDRFKFEAAKKAGYTMIRIQEPGLEVLDLKYDIVMPEGFYRNGKYDAEIMEEVGRKVIHLLEEIYGRKASPEIWALNNFKEFEVWFATHKNELEANALKHMKSHKTAAKMAA